MATDAKTFLRNLVPDPVLGIIRNWRGRKEGRAITDLQLVLDTAPTSPEWLSADELEQLCIEFTFPTPYGYDENAVEERGQQRAEFVPNKLNGKPAQTFLDLACFDGMTAAALQRQGRSCWGVDLTDSGFDARARHAGVQFAAMDASAMSFADGFFDVVYSFNAFEHFEHPEIVLREALRVTKPGGHVILRFGPLYASAKGLHAYDRIPVPYCQFLFPLEVMNGYLRKNSLEEIDPAHCNQWSVQQFRELWKSVSDLAVVCTNEEFTWLEDLPTVRRYPSCFKGKVGSAEDLAVNIIEVALTLRE